MSDTGDSGAIASGPNLGGRGRGRGRNSAFNNINAKVSVDGLTDMRKELGKIAGYTKEIRQNFEAINAAGRSGGSVWSRILGRGGTGPQAGGGNWMLQLPTVQQRGPSSPVGGGAPPAGTTTTQQQQGGGGSTMPWMARLGTAAVVGSNILSSRISRNIAESTPILAQSSLLSSMYGGMMPAYNQIEMQRFRDLGRYGGTRQEQAQTQQIALRYGQTPQQAGRFMQGVGNFTQAMGGTMTSTQVAQATGGFLDPMVLRRQRSQGMEYARVGGQVKNPGEIAQEYIKNYEQRRNRGVKLNQFDFINLQTPGHPLRITFNRLYGLDDASIDLISTVGMQTAGRGGQLDYNSQASVAAMGMDRSRLGGAAAALATTRGRREGSFAQQNESGMVTQLRMEQSLQEALTGVEDAASGLTSTFAALDRVIQGATTGLAMLLGGGAMAGMAGARGGGGLVGKLLGGAGAAAAATGAPGAPGAAPIAGAGRFGAVAGQAALGVGGAVAGVGAIKTAVNAKGWGDIFSAGAQGAAAGAMFGAMSGTPFGPVVGAAGGFVFAAGAAGISALMGNAGAGDQEERVETSQEAGNLTDKQIIDRFISGAAPRRTSSGQIVNEPGVRNGFSPEMWKTFRAPNDPRINGLVDRYQVRRSALIARFMEDVVNRHPDDFENMMRRRVKLEGGTIADHKRDWGELLDRFNGFASSPDDTVNDDQYNSAGDDVIKLTELLRFPKERGRWRGYTNLNNLYKEYFGGLRHPMIVRPVYTPAAIDIIDEYSFNTNDLALGQTGGQGQQGDPEDTATESSTLNFASVNNMPMAPEPRDPTGSWSGMHPTMKKRLRAMFAASKGAVRWENGGGTRTEAEQERLFLSRYRVDPNGEVEWRGKRWKRFTGAAAAPPGRSMHEIGLAADLGGPGVGNGWVKKNAKRFGLKEFSNVNDEPWHVQPAELPNSRRQYEDEGASWGGGGGPDEEGGADPAIESATAEGGGGGFSGGASGLGGTSLGTLGMGTSSLGLLAGGSSVGGAALSTSGATTAAAADTSTDDIPTDGEPLTFEQVTRLAHEAGFRGDDLQVMVAIAKAESGHNPGAVGDVSLQDAKWGPSIGLWQVRSLKAQKGTGKERDADRLTDPKFNAASAWSISSQGSNFRPWSVFNRTSHLQFMDEAAAAMSSLNMGDAVFDHGIQARSILSSMNDGDSATTGTGGLALPSGGVGRSVAGRLMGTSVNGQPLNVNVTINSSGNYAYDAKQLARHVRPAFEAEYAEVSAKRNM